MSSEQNGIIINYLINMTTDTGETLTFTTNDTTYAVHNLEAFTVFHFVVAAETSSGSGPFSTPVPIRTGEDSMFSAQTVHFIL